MNKRTGAKNSMNILAICGSINKSSSNLNILNAIRKFLKQETQWNYFKIEELPFFDPQLQFDKALPESVQTLRSLAQTSDFIVISTPEYAHGIPGVLKNALEWLICEETMKKKVAIIIGSPSGGEFVKDYLTETIRTMDLLPADNRTLIITSARSDIASDGEILNEELEIKIKKFVHDLWE